MGLVNNENNENKVRLVGKVAKFPKNVKAKAGFSFLENIRIPKKKLWYFIIEKETIIDDNEYEEIQVIKYNNKQGVDCKAFVETLKEHYKKDEQMYDHIKNLIIDGSENFSTIRNIHNVEINGKKLISIITEDLIRLLYK
jgi:hypothetical protein